jgi:hypothetical protein
MFLQIVGWGKTENGKLSPVLLETTLPYIDHNSCRDMYTNGFQIFLTVDKFCAGSALGNTILNYLCINTVLTLLHTVKQTFLNV